MTIMMTRHNDNDYDDDDDKNDDGDNDDDEDEDYDESGGGVEKSVHNDDENTPCHKGTIIHSGRDRNIAPSPERK